MSHSRRKSHDPAASREAGYLKSLELMRRCVVDEGFLASPQDRDNYRRVWARDSCVIGLAALASKDEMLVDTLRRSLVTLARHQGPHGEIPNNYEPSTGRVSYGDMAGAVDATLWFVIGCGQYWQATGDGEFLDDMLRPLERARFVLGAWEFNSRGLLYVPLTADWADEYIHNGFVLHDQLLYLQAKRELCAIHHAVHHERDHSLEESASRLKRMIRDNYWFDDGGPLPDDVYHDVLYEKGRSAADWRHGQYWMPFFTPAGYGFRFDATANALVSLVGVAESQQQDQVDRFIAEGLDLERMRVLPAFYPPILPKDEAWQELQVTFTYDFKNQPYQYQNGGLWPHVTGFYVADLAARGKGELAREYLAGIHQANALAMEGEPWGFPEYVDGSELTPGGTRFQGWSAAAAVMGHHAIEGRPFFLSDEPA